MEFTKMHGLGNDYLLVDAMRGGSPPEQKLPAIARALSDRHFGVGADGLILVEPSRVADFKMRIFNSDGSEAEMCGNGVRLFARYVYERGYTRERDMEVETLAGIIRPRLRLRGGKVTAVRVDMGEPRLRRSEIPMKGPDQERVVGERMRVLGRRYEITAVSMGNPHCVIFVHDTDRVKVHEVGPAIEHHDLFPRRTNVEFAQVVGDGELTMRVWERGAGETLACGTGASAALVAAVLNGLSPRKATIHLRGGDLKASWNQEDNHVFIEGPAEEVCTGETRLDEAL
ncbi:MAG TPA: diaminopimelate epimerase [Armatimonadota bacterium]|nr:diaminopimelate epimerase [Armatimonadota bacterium]